MTGSYWKAVLLIERSSTPTTFQQGFLDLLVSIHDAWQWNILKGASPTSRILLEVALSRGLSVIPEDWTARV